MKVLVEVFDGKTVRPMLVSQDELKNFVPMNADTDSKTDSRLPKSQKWMLAPNNKIKPMNKTAA